MHKRTVLMNPGPVVVDERVRAALGWPDMCHREPEFSDLMTRIREKITRICGGDNSDSTVLLTGSGTAALEATIASAVPPEGKLLVLDNGHYGERLAKIAEVHNLPRIVLKQAWALPIDLGQVEKVLTADPAITHVALVHHETSTGMLNPGARVGEICARLSRSLILDAISSLAGEPLNVRADHIDWCVGTANKCIEGIPGISFICAPRAKLDALAKLPQRSLYMNLHNLYVAEDKAKAPPFTPAVQTCFALDVALDLLLAEGVAARHARYRSRAQQLRAGLEKLGFRMLLPPEHRSSTLTALYLPNGMEYPELHDRLKAEGFVIYAGQDTLKEKVFRLANMGQISAAEIQQFLRVLERVIQPHATR